MNERKIDVSPNINAYFEEVVQDAMRVRRLDATTAAEHYLVGLLADHARGDQVGSALDRPLTFQLNDALQEHGATRFQKLRVIGDTVLYVLGFFGSCLTRRGADRRYVLGVGASAYDHASAMLRLGGNDGHDVLRELSRKFQRFVEVLSEIAQGILAPVDHDARLVLSLYQSWQQEGSEQLARVLGAKGLCPVRSGEGLH